MIQFIFPYDSIDDGRKKIDATFFSGYTPSGYWNSLNSGNTGFSLEFTASTAGVSNNNSDISNNSNSIIIGNNNIISGNSGYNFLKGKNNLLNRTSFSYIDGDFNKVSGITSSFIFGRNLSVSGATNSAFINTFNSIISKEFKINNGTLLGGISYEFMGQNSLSENDFLLGVNTNRLRITGNTNYFTALNGLDFYVSGSVKNCLVAGALNKIGYDYPVPSNGSHENIYIFGSGITPSLSATSNTSLSGTYANSICVENALIFNKESANYSLVTTAKTEFSENNLYQVNGLSGNKMAAVSKDLNNLFHASTTGSGLFFIIYFDDTYVGGTLSGSSNNFVDDGYNNRIDISTNLYSANTAFYGYSNDLKKYIKYKG